MDDLNVKGGVQQKPTPAATSTTPSTPTTGLRQCGNDATRNTGRSGRQNTATRCSTRREEWKTVQGPVKKLLLHRGWGRLDAG